MQTKLAIQSLLHKPEAQPETLRPMFSKLAESQSIFTNVEKAIAQTQNSLAQLFEQRSRAIGAGDAVAELIGSQLTPELIAEYSKEQAQADATTK